MSPPGEDLNLKKTAGRACTDRIQCSRLLKVSLRRHCLLFMTWIEQEVRSGRGLFLKYQQCMRELVAEVKARGSPSENDPSIAAHLLRLKDPDTGLPLSDDILTGEFGVYFTAGIESAGNAMSWTL